VGCRWTTRAGKRTKIGAAGPSLSVASIGSFQVAGLMRGLGIFHLILSPAKTPEDLEGATLRLWLHPEQGYMVEARSSPNTPPQYHHVSQEEATRLEINRPSAEFISRMLHPAGIPDH